MICPWNVCRNYSLWECSHYHHHHHYYCHSGVDIPGLAVSSGRGLLLRPIQWKRHEDFGLVTTSPLANKTINGRYEA